MKQYGLIGYPLKNSFSVNYFTSKFKLPELQDHFYENFPLENIEDFPDFLKLHPDLIGLSVTIPHKQSIIKYLDELDESVTAVGAVNCIKIIRGQSSDALRQKAKLIGYNTDIYGFENSLVPFIEDFKGKALILGTGGAAKAVAHVLKKLNINFSFVSRNPHDKSNTISYSSIDNKTIKEHELIVNCTPLGMYPDTNNCPPIPYQFISDKHFAYDLIYLPEETLFMKKCNEYGAKTKNGLEMLHLQADGAWEIFCS